MTNENKDQKQGSDQGQQKAAENKDQKANPTAQTK